MSTTDDLAAMEEIARLEAQKNQAKAAPKSEFSVKDAVNASVKAGNEVFTTAARGLLKPLTAPSTALSVRDGLMGGLGAAMRDNRPQFAKDAENWVEGKRKAADDWVERTFPRKGKQTPLDAPGTGEGPAENIFKDTLEGGMSGLLIPFGGPAAAFTTGMASGFGGNIGRRAGEQAGFPVTGEILGNLLGGTAGGFASGPRQSVARQDLRRELPNPNSPDWAIAQRNAQDAASAGATTFTAADAFPGKGGIIPLTTQTAQSQGGEVLRQKLAKRPEDLQRLGDTFLNRVGPEVDTNAVATQLSKAAEGTIEGRTRQVKDALANRLATLHLPPQQAEGLRYNLLHAAQLEKDPATRQGYLDLAKRLTQADGKPKTSVQEISLEIKAARESADNPLNTTNGASSIDRFKAKPAYDLADSIMSQYSRAYREGHSDFGTAMRSVDAMKDGTLGRLAARNPLMPHPEPLGKLDAVAMGNPPRIAGGFAKQLNDPVLTDKTGWFTSGETVEPRDIIRGLAQEKLKNGSYNPGETVRGLPGSLTERRYKAMLDAGGVDANHAFTPLGVADQMQNLTPAGQLTREIKPGAGNWVRPFRALDMLLTGKSQEKITQEIARLVADPNNIPELQRIAMFNPNVRRALTAVGGTLPALRAFNQSQEK